jgi:hypothetical protein
MKKAEDDNLGLGKILQVLSLIQARKGAGPTLIITQATVVDHWAAEIMANSDMTSVFIYKGVDRNTTVDKLQSCDVVITSYGSLYIECNPSKTKKKAAISAIAPAAESGEVVVAAEPEEAVVEGSTSLLCCARWHRVI